MRILYDSKQSHYKTPFGTLVPGQICTLNIHIPSTVQATHVLCILNHEYGATSQEVTLERVMKKGAYDIFRGEFSIPSPGLYFYYFRIFAPNNSFRLFKVGDDANMEAGDMWQLSCVPADFTTPEWARGATIYQIFPDRFHKSGDCDLTGKLKPYTVHPNWYEDVDWRPSPSGEILNNDFFGGNFRGIAEKMDYIAPIAMIPATTRPLTPCLAPWRTSGPWSMPPTTGESR